MFLVLNVEWNWGTKYEAAKEPIVRPQLPAKLHMLH